MKAKLIPEEIGEFLSYDPDTGVLRWKVDRGPVKAGRVAGSANSSGYLQVKFRGLLYKNHRIAWFMHYVEQPPPIVDHDNEDRLDNRIENLRPASRSENGWNRGKNKNNTSGVKGVDRRRGKFRARVTSSGRQKHLGYYNTQEEADKAAIKFREEHQGDFANHG